MSDNELATPYDDAIVRRFFWATLTWLFVSTLVGIYAAILKIAPEWVGDPRLAFGRMKPVHTNVALFGLMANAVFALVYYSTQRLCGRAMFSWGLSRLHFWSWQALVFVAAFTTPLGITTSRPHAEWEWPIDLAMAISWIGLFGVNFTLTLARRRVDVAYVSLWFYGAAVAVVGLVHCLISLATPIDGWTSVPMVSGIADATLSYFYSHNLNAFLMTAPLMGAMYYFVPKMVGRPLVNYPLAIVHFWSLILLILWAAPAAGHYTPIAEWITSLGMMFSIAILMPALAGVVVGLQTIRSSDASTTNQPAVRFVAASLIFYAIDVVLRTIGSLKFFDGWMHFTDWHNAMSHLFGIGFASMMIIGLLYWLMPRLFQTSLASPAMASGHFYVSLLAIGFYVVPSFIAAVVQSNYMMSLDEIGNLANPEFQGVLPNIVPAWTWSILGGVLFAIGCLLMVVNAVRTWASRPSTYEPRRPFFDPELADANPASSSGTLGPTSSDAASPVDDGSTTQPSSLDGVPVLDLARRLERFRELQWHQRYEQLPRRIMLPVLAMLALALIVEVLPMCFAAHADAVIVASNRLTPLEQLGRDIYRREGCVNCHSQMVRPLVAETKRYSAPITRTEVAGRRPMLWGHRRIGPDLGREGGLQPSLWHWNHLRDPRSVNSESVMPRFEHLTRRRWDSDRLVLIALGPIDDRESMVDGIDGSTDDPEERRNDASSPALTPSAANEQTTSEKIVETLADARRQAEAVAADIVSQGGPLSTNDILTIDSEATALIAFLQRLGVELAIDSVDTSEAASDAVATADAP